MSSLAVTDVPDLLAALAAAGERPALSFYRGKACQGRLSYGELASKVEALARILHFEHGVGAGDRVAVLGPNRLEVPVVVLALLRLAAVVVPLNPAAAVTDWDYILEHSGARGLFATDELRARIGSRLSFALPLEALPAAGESQARTDSLPSPEGLSERLGVVLYTSGTTGNPKGVALRQRNLLANARSMAENFGLDASAQLAVLPLYHAHAFGFGLMTALLTGGHLVFTERLEPFTWAAVIRAERIEVTSVVPTFLPMLLAAAVSRGQAPSLRHILVSSAPLGVDLARDFEHRTAIPLIQGWGLSEYTNFACCLSPQDSAEEHARLMFEDEVPSIGPALAGTEVQVVDSRGARMAEGERGELLVRGPSTMAGYLGDAESTAAAIDADQWLRTGDEGFFRQSGGRKVFFITGRLKEIIIRDAEKYSPLRLERTLTAAVPELAGVAVVLGFAHQEHGEEVGAYVQIEQLAEGLKARILGAILAMPVAERPKVVLHGAEDIPRTHTGKVQRRKMAGWFAAWAGHRGPPVIAAHPAGAAPNS